MLQLSMLRSETPMASGANSTDVVFQEFVRPVRKAQVHHPHLMAGSRRGAGDIAQADGWGRQEVILEVAVDQENPHRSAG